MSTSTLERIVKGFIYATFFVPLVVVPSSFIFPFIVPKVLLLRTLIIFALAFYIALLVHDWERYRPRLSPLSWALLAWGASFTVSTILGVDAYHSFWDNHERMLGLFTILHYLVYFFICRGVFRSWGEWRLALWGFLAAGSIVMIIALLQVGNPDLLLNQGSDRTASTLGNPIYVGGYGLFLFFVALLLVFRERNNVWRGVAGALGVLAFLGMFYSGTRGSLLGWIVGIASLTVGGAILASGRPRLRQLCGGAAVLAVVILGIFYYYRRTDFVRNIPTLGRLLNSSLYSGTGSTRLIAWQIAVESWRERPVFGWGPNNYFYAFNQHYNPRSLEFGPGETWFDNAHNIILNTLTVQGAVGIVSYLAIFITALLILLRRRVRTETISVTLAGGAFLIAHLLQNITVFENPTSYLYFMFWLALVEGAGVAPAVNPEPAEPRRRFSAAPPSGAQAPVAWVGGAAVAALVVIFIFNLQPARANQKTLALLEMLARDPLAALGVLRTDLQFSSPHIDDIRSDIARSIISLLGSSQAEALGRDRALEMVRLIYGELQTNVTLHPRDIRNHMTLAQLGQFAAVGSGDPRYWLEAEQYLETARQFSPRRQQLIYALSGIKAQLGKGPEAVTLLESAISDNARIGENYWRLAYLYYFLGQTKNALAVLERAREAGLAFDDQGIQVANLIRAAAGATGTAPR
ncbi:MAG: O-antigen ligase family protein [Candidatus Magasanikbacteria bacterium]|nr:O-antigen ligase family protein [Candidatus Magasanikbacteria bacterium]